MKADSTRKWKQQETQLRRQHTSLKPQYQFWLLVGSHGQQMYHTVSETNTHHTTSYLPVGHPGFPLYFGIKIQGLFKDFQGP